MVSNLMSMLASPGVPPWCHPSVSTLMFPYDVRLGIFWWSPTLSPPLGVHLNISRSRSPDASWVSPLASLCSPMVLSPWCRPLGVPPRHTLIVQLSISWCSSTALSSCCSPWCPSQDLLRAVSGTIIFLVVALVALAASRDALAATTFVSVMSPIKTPQTPAPTHASSPSTSPGPASFSPPQTFSLILSFLFAFDTFVTYRAEVAPAVGQGEYLVLRGRAHSGGRGGNPEQLCPLAYHLPQLPHLSLPDPDVDST